MVFVIPKKTSGAFTFQLEGSKKTYKIPYAQNLPLDIQTQMQVAVVVAGKAQKAQQKGREYTYTSEDVEKMQTAQLALIQRYAPELLSELSSQQLAQLLEAWGEESQMKLGES